MKILMLVVLLFTTGCATVYTRPSGLVWAYTGEVHSENTHGLVYSVDKGSCEALRKVEPATVQSNACSLATIGTGAGVPYWAVSFGQGDVGVAFPQSAHCEFARGNLSKYHPSKC